MKKYHYPDENDGLTIKFLAEFEKSEQYWDQSENTILEIINKQISATIKGGVPRSFLDAGCGNGRLIPKFANQFDKIVALEPDSERLNHAGDLIKSLGLEQKTSFSLSLAEEFKSDMKFDFILNSHVIQHIHTGLVKPLLKNLADHLKKEGVLAITSCHSTQKREHYLKNYVQNGKPVREDIDEITHNKLVNSNGALPIHFFRTDTLINMLTDLGLETFVFKVFHVDKPDREKLQVEDVDAYINAATQRQNKYGIDMCLLARKLI